MSKVEKQDITTTSSFLFKEMLKMKRREMTPGVRRRNQNPKVTQVHLYPFPQERRYTRYLFNLMDIYSDMTTPILRENMERWVDEQKLDSVREDDFNTEFQELINRLRNTQFNMFDPEGAGVTDDKGNFYNAGIITAALTTLGISISTFNKKQGNKFTKQILGAPFLPSEPWLDTVIDGWANTNFELIKSLSDEYIKKLNFIVPEGIANGDTWDKIMRDFRKMDTNMTRSRARLLARDQTGKLNGRLTKRRNQELGLDLYRWRTAQDERVRPTHKPLNGKIMRWDDNAVYADTVEDARAGNWKQRSSINGYIGIPQQDIQCRCTSTAVFDPIIEEIDKELSEEE
jgi:SPP1 gp7 family putative phage head morphogenesis protein